MTNKQQFQAAAFLIVAKEEFETIKENDAGRLQKPALAQRRYDGGTI